MSAQSEQILENNLISQLTKLGYERVSISGDEDIERNLKSQLERFNNITFSDREFKQVLNQLSKGSIFERARNLRERFVVERENGDPVHIRFFNSEEPEDNLYQVTNQVTQNGTYKNRYDVTLLVNGLPLVQIELKRRGLELKEAFNQINRYKRHSFWANSGLFQFVQFFVISNGVNTKYYANNLLTSLTFKQTFYWADSNNKNIQELTAFANAFLNAEHLGNMVAKYVVINETHKTLMVLRPYQYYAVEAIVKRVRDNTGNGYIWHTTGSGKTLTSFKASQIAMNLPAVHKVVFVVDRKDLDYQTMNEFNAFKKGSVDVTINTSGLVSQLKDDTKLVVTTIQKLNNAIRKNHFKSQIEQLQNKKVVFIFDECHRSQFGETHLRITSFFTNSQLFGFTGTPIFAKNASKNDLGKRTTKVLFQDCLHRYVITDAIRDQNVLQFSVEYIGRYKKKSQTYIDIEVEDIDQKEVIDSKKRIKKIANYIIQQHDRKTHNRKYSALFAVSNIKNLIAYYETFAELKKAGKHDLRIATIFTYTANEEDEDAQGMLGEENPLALAAEDRDQYVSSHTREKLDAFISDYNSMYQTNFSTRDDKAFENYYKDISKKLKDRERVAFNNNNRIDILLVVGMFLTGFDAKMVNTLYVDRNLKYHGLIQAYSRTNRIINEQKSQGNIVAFRNLKYNTDEALALFSDKEAEEEIFIPEYDLLVKKFVESFAKLLAIAPTVASVAKLEDENKELEFIKAFRQIIRAYNVLKTHVDFTWEDLPLSEQAFEDYKSKYLDLHDEVKSRQRKEKESILDDVDFEIELIHRDEINVAYILKLLAKLGGSKAAEKEKQKKAIIDLLTGDVNLRSKRELIEKFIEEQLPKIQNLDDVADQFEQFWQDQKVLALNQLCEEENLDRKQFSKLIDTFVYTELEPLRDEVFACLDNRPSILKAREIGERIINKMKDFVQTFVLGMTG
jgi:type I restriction enzyme R subunit